MMSVQIDQVGFGVCKWALKYAILGEEDAQNMLR
jgi:hypothetical protein